MIDKIYIDLDGVLANFWGRVCEIFGKEPDNNRVIWHKLKEYPDLFLELKPLPYATIMFNKIYSVYDDKCEILTAIPNIELYGKSAAYDKKMWVMKYLNDRIIVNTVDSHSRKKEFCRGKNCILIDDYHKNISDWKSRGGTGILHKDWQTTCHELMIRGIL